MSTDMDKDYLVRFRIGLESYERIVLAKDTFDVHDKMKLNYPLYTWYEIIKNYNEPIT